MKSVAIGIAGIPLTGCALAVGIIFGSLLIAESYSPEYGSALFARAMVGFGLVETFALFVLGIVGLIVIF
jgi:F0F1-type ATP synthase membrane subunit c/vacuolar-type H+-ATPase subunit K